MLGRAQAPILSWVSQGCTAMGGRHWCKTRYISPECAPCSRTGGAMLCIRPGRVGIWRRPPCGPSPCRRRAWCWRTLGGPPRQVLTSERLRRCGVGGVGTMGLSGHPKGNGALTRARRVQGNRRQRRADGRICSTDVTDVRTGSGQTSTSLTVWRQTDPHQRTEGLKSDPGHGSA